MPPSAAALLLVPRIGLLGRLVECFLVSLCDLALVMLIGSSFRKPRSAYLDGMLQSFPGTASDHALIRSFPVTSLLHSWFAKVL